MAGPLIGIKASTRRHGVDQRLRPTGRREIIHMQQWLQAWSFSSQPAMVDEALRQVVNFFVLSGIAVGHFGQGSRRTWVKEGWNRLFILPRDICCYNQYSVTKIVTVGP